MTDTVDLTSFNPFDPAVQQCPFPHYAAMRVDQPVFRVPGTLLHLVTRHDLFAPILRDTTTFSNRFGSTGESPDPETLARLAEIQATGWPQVPTMLTEDPPAHTRYRGTVAPAFTPRRIKALEPAVREVCREVVAACAGAGNLDVVRRLAVPIPVRVIAEVLNVPDDRLDDFKRWSDDSTVAIGASVEADARLAAQRGIVEFQHYFADQLDRRRHSPEDDLLSVLVQSRVEGDDGEPRALDTAEMLSIVQQLLVAGNETTTKLLTEAVRLLAEHPGAWAQLRDDPAGTAPAVVEEALRLATPTQGMFRVVTRDTEVDGVSIPAGSKLVLVYAAANRDPAIFPEPDSFDLDRANLRDHLAFGRGIHFCIGAPLARLEATVAVEELASGVAEIRLDPGNDFAYEPSFLLRGLKRLDAELVPA